MFAKDSDLAVTYSLIYSFLTERSHFKAAEAVRKAAKDVVTIEAGGRDEPTLPVIVKQWKKFTADQGKKAMSQIESTKLESSCSDTDSDVSEDSESSSEEVSSELDSETKSRPLKSNKRSKDKVISFLSKSFDPTRPNTGAESKVKPPASKSLQLSSEPDGELSSSSDPKSDESENDEVERVIPDSTSKFTRAEQTTIAVSHKSRSRDSTNSHSDSSQSSSDEGSDSEFEEDAPTLKAMAMKVDGTTVSSVPESRSPTGSSRTLPTTKSSDGSDNDSESSGSSTSVDDSSPASDPDSGSSSDGISNTVMKSAQASDKLQKMKVTSAVNTPTIDFPQKNDGPTVVTKRRRTDEMGNSVVTSIIQQPKRSYPRQKGDGKGPPRKTNAPFSRIKVDEIKFSDERLKDNTFESRRATTNDYGAKANADLIVTKGASFRKEKNKKKRGSYRGGDITMESHSIKFTDCL
ncbi:hypothetical protein BDM02DRAFT_3145651 [Thelephora ganbajun]|uniref:Uncharacterized protein n=1 Tax=Thelephora ganbajun TaxID=370292 RepID=A0ACB6ZDJ2_THEGA|nr:hypothetical protein BDM02DRAFT_3145651 [Thelephora ganbajun]